jgi:hypothetical protein
METRSRKSSIPPFDARMNEIEAGIFGFILRFHQMSHKNFFLQASNRRR